MRNERNSHGAKFVVIGAAGLAVSLFGGTLAGQSAAGSIDTFYRGLIPPDRPERSSSAASDLSASETSSASYATIATFGGRARPATGISAEDAVFTSDTWERDAEADYQRWQARLDAEVRLEHDRVAHTSYEDGDEPGGPTQIVQAGTGSNPVAEVTNSTSADRGDVRPANDVDAVSSVAIDEDQARLSDGSIAHSPAI